jgi:hypothetical protein
MLMGMWVESGQPDRYGHAAPSMAARHGSSLRLSTVFSASKCEQDQGVVLPIDKFTSTTSNTDLLEINKIRIRIIVLRIHGTRY